MSVVIGLALGLASAACGDAFDPAPPADVASSRAPLIDGDLAAAQAFPFTLQILGGCTAAKVGPRQILTAAHCVRLANGAVHPAYASGATLQLILRGTAAGQRAVVVQSTAVHPRVTTYCGSHGCGASAAAERRDAPDLAVIEVVGGLDDVPTATVDSTPIAPNDAVTLVGYGCTGNIRGNADGRLRYLDGRVGDVDDTVHPGGLRADEDAALASVAANYTITRGPGAPVTLAAPAPAERGGLCPGDSGGPLVRAGTNQVVGVNASYTFLPAGVLPVTNWHARVDRAARWGAAAWLEARGVSVSPPCSSIPCTSVSP